MSDNLKTVEVNIDLMEVPVVFKSKAGDKTYIIREMPAPLLFDFVGKNKELAEANMDKQGNFKLNFTDMSKVSQAIPLLLEKCLYDPEGKPITEEEINKLPLRVQQKLMEVAQEVNGLTSAAAEQAGNLQTETESGTDLPLGSTVPSPSAKEKQE